MNRLFRLLSHEIWAEKGEKESLNATFHMLILLCVRRETKAKIVIFISNNSPF